MKKRFLGLLATLLCLLLAGMPAAMAASDPYVEFITNDGEIIHLDGLIQGESSAFANSCAHTAYVYAYSSWNGSTSDSYDEKKTGSVPASSTLWHVVQFEEEGLSWNMRLEAVGEEIDTADLNVPEGMLVFNGALTSNINTSDEAYPVGIETALNSWVTSKQPGAGIAIYDAAIYQKQGDCYWKKVNPSQPVDFELPVEEDAAVEAVLHWNNNAIEELTFEQTKSGKVLVKDVQHFSPFAVVYTPDAFVPPPAPVPSAPSVPQTGDSSQPILWFALLLTGLSGMALLIKSRKRA